MRRVRWSDLTTRLAASRIEGLDLGLNPAAVRGRSDLRKDRADNLDHAVLHVLGCVLEGRLDDVVGERVAKQTLHLSRSQQLVDNHVLGRIKRTPKTLLNNVGAEFVARQLANAVAELGNQRLREGRLVEVDYILNNVVAEGVLDQRNSMVGNSLYEPHLLIARGMVNATLQNTAAMAVGADLDASTTDGVEDELGIYRAELVEALLNDVVAV